MKILFYFFRLETSGGAERMICRLASEMHARGHEVQIVSWDGPGSEAFYPLPREVKWHKLGFVPGLKDKIRRTRALRRLCREERPDVFVGFVMSADKTIYAANLGTGVPMIAAERNAPTMYGLKMGAFRQALYFNLFRLCRKIAVQFEEYRNGYPAYLHEKIVAIPNPVKPASAFARPGDDTAGIRMLLAVGRLVDQKQFEVLLNAYALIADEFPDWCLRIVGDGENRGSLEHQIQSLGLSNRVTLPGATSDIQAEYVNAHLFVLPSRWEGFPNALAEALAHGLPAAGFADCPGVNDLIADGSNGLMAAGTDDPQSLANTLRRLMADDKLRREMGAQAVESMEPYEPRKVFDFWETLLEECPRRC